MVYRRYASLYFIIGCDIEADLNELAMLEFIHNLVETLDKYFENVCELDVSGARLTFIFVDHVQHRKSALYR